MTTTGFRPLLVAAAVIATAACENLDRYGASDTLEAPSGLVALPASSSTIALTWDRPVGTDGQVTYRLFRNGTEIGTVTSTGATTAHADNGLSASTTYTYTTIAVDRLGNTSPESGSATATTFADGVSDTDAPSAPTDLTAVAGSSSNVTLTWTPSTDETGVLGYRIFRDGVQVATSSGTTYNDTGLAASTEYTYTVAAYDGAANVSAASSPASATTLASNTADTEAPSVPTGLTAVAGSANTIALSWNPSTDNIGVAGYIVYRDGTVIDTTATAAYADVGLCAMTAHAYTVAAFDGAGNTSARSAPANATTLNVGVDLGTAADFSVLAGTGLTLTGLLPSAVTGNVGVSPGNAIAGLPLLDLLTGVLHAGDGTAAAAQVDLNDAYGALLGQPVCGDNNLSGQNLGGLTLEPGVHGFSSNASLNGTLTLDAGGDPNAVFLIKTSGSLNAANGAQVVLTGGAQPENVYWVVGGATSVGAGATMRGNILTSSSATLGLGAQVDGRVLARNGGVSLLVNSVGL